MIVQHRKRRSGNQISVLLVNICWQFSSDGHVNPVAQPLVLLVEHITEAVRIIGEVISDGVALVVIDLQEAQSNAIHSRGVRCLEAVASLH